MATFDLYSKRRRRQVGDPSDVLSYDKIPAPFRVQVIHLWNDALGDAQDYQMSLTGVEKAYEFVVNTLRREYGKFQLAEHYLHDGNYRIELQTFLLSEKACDRVLDTIELSFRFIDRLTREESYRQRGDAGAIADGAIKELNERFKEHGIGYSYEGGELIRVDSQFVHAEVVKPAFVLLSEKRFAGAQDEFRSAYEHYRKGDNKDALRLSRPPPSSASWSATSSSLGHRLAWRTSRTRCSRPKKAGGRKAAVVVAQVAAALAVT